MIGIYRITNIITNQSYIGQSKDIERRWGEHDKMLSENKHHSKKLQNSYNTFGPHAFIKTVIHVLPVYDEKKLDNLEIDYIRMFNSYFRGFNMKPTG